jgi:hypothetical protein
VAKPTKKLEDILVEAGIATARELERARGRMGEGGGRLLAQLAKNDGFDDVKLARILAKTLGLPLATRQSLERVAAPRTPSRRAALRVLALERVLLPIGATRNPQAVAVAMFDPTDSEAIERVRTICGGARVKVQVAPRRELLDAIAHTFGREAAGVLSAPASEGDLDEDAKTGVDIDLRVTPAPESVEEGAEETTTPGTRDVPLTRVLLQAVSVLSELLEERLGVRPGPGRRLAILARLVARELGLAHELVDEIGLAAHLHAVDRLHRGVCRREGRTAADLGAELGWMGASPEGVVPILSALTVVADGLPAVWRQPRPLAEVDAPLGAQVIAAVAEYLSLAEATSEGQPDEATLNQLLRVTTAPEILSALQRVIGAKTTKETIHGG